MIRLAVRAPATHAEPVLAALLELSPGGVEQVDGEGFVEYALYGAPGELPALPRGDAQVAGVTVIVSGEEVADDWADRWRRYHRPVEVGGRLLVRPPWEPPPGDEVIDVVIDPGRAFGTGAHPTTRLCLELMLALDPWGSLVDVGCGSGVLAIAAAKLGFSPVTAIDNEAAAVDATIANARANGVILREVAVADVRAASPPEADVAVANLVRPLLLRLAELMVRPGRFLLLSGLLEGEEDEVAAAFAPLREVRRLSADGWSALLLSPH